MYKLYIAYEDNDVGCEINTYDYNEHDKFCLQTHTQRSFKKINKVIDMSIQNDQIVIGLSDASILSSSNLYSYNKHDELIWSYAKDILTVTKPTEIQLVDEQEGIVRVYRNRNVIYFCVAKYPTTFAAISQNNKYVVAFTTYWNGILVNLVSNEETNILIDHIVNIVKFFNNDKHIMFCGRGKDSFLVSYYDINKKIVTHKKEFPYPGSVVLSKHVSDGNYFLIATEQSYSIYSFGFDEYGEMEVEMKFEKNDFLSNIEYYPKLSKDGKVLITKNCYNEISIFDTCTKQIIEFILLPRKVISYNIWQVDDDTDIIYL